MPQRVDATQALREKREDFVELIGNRKGESKELRGDGDLGRESAREELVEGAEKTMIESRENSVIWGMMLRGVAV